MSETENETPEIEETDAVEAPAEESAVAEEAPAAAATEEAAPAPEEAVPAAQSGPKKKRKHLPRALRPQKGRRQRERATERKPISREPKPEHERGRHQERRGVVVSDKGDKTVVVKVERTFLHPVLKKTVRRSKKYHAHDDKNEFGVGDVVWIEERRPISKLKCWEVIRGEKKQKVQ